MSSVTKRLLLLVVALLLIVISVVLGLFAGFYYQKTDLEQEIALIIPPGMSTRHIAKKLHQHKVISNPTLFILLSKIGYPSAYLQAGEYSFATDDRVKDVFHKLVTGKVLEHKLTVVEGIESFVIYDALMQESRLSGTLVPIREGSLLPETYIYRYGETKQSVVKQMQEAQERAFIPLWEARDPKVSLTKEEVLILASIIAKETNSEAEMPKMAGVFYNRMRANMLLQTDPTVIYAITQGKEAFSRELTLKDLSIDSPYNTYRYKGLPPTPIANPSIPAIEAVLHPEETDRYYFYADGKGGHYFSKNYEEHRTYIKKRKALEAQSNKDKE